MDKLLNDINTIKGLLIKVQIHIQKNQKKLFHELGGLEQLKKDSRILSFSLQRMIVFCAINDCDNLSQNFQSKSYRKIKSSLKENFPDELMILGLKNYPMYNYIIRFSSIIETGTRSFLKHPYNKYKKSVDSEIWTAGKIIQAWRNTIHKNGYLDKEEEFNYHGKSIEISESKAFEFDIMDLYRISKQCSDLVVELVRIDSKTIV